MVAHSLSFGAFVGAWQFYAVQFWLRIQQKAPITIEIDLLQIAILGILATWVVSKTFHVVPGNFLYLAAMFAFAMGPAFFLPQTVDSLYWALSLPGVALGTFGSDLSFAAVSIYITSSVPRSYQGSAGSLLVPVQNLSSAVMTSVADTIGTKVDQGPSRDIGLTGLRAIGWLWSRGGDGCGARHRHLDADPKEEEKEQVTWYVHVLSVLYLVG
ncbi:hypothetical protein N7532_009686 [Penicillium argentinense]|uniref:Uncharacterized protein n=1 Tax=Penicillium argentinense TaxID=1131581 RepID=A0A9W9EZX2_9EURO|nr:uncharacterized protein N7532_009686 [Penicillium argentinense]KAJ5091002.1 hypothetical protein N7532_009686 [Penicillium argentinense]